MTTNIHADLVERHQAMQAQLASQPDTLATETILEFLAEAQAAGATIEDVRQREQLRAILRHWGGIIFDRQGDYPAIQLVPFAGVSTRPSPIPAPPVEDEGVKPTPSNRWSPLTIAVSVIFIVLVLILLPTFLGLMGDTEASPTEVAVVIEVTVVVTEESISDGPTETPIPSPSLTPTKDQVEPAGEDTDGDLLLDYEEEELGTNPFAADSDGDGLEDGDELFRWGTDPLNFDSDGDGLLDGEDAEPMVPSTPTPTLTATPVPTETPTPQTAVPHTVQRGETLAAIAEQYGVSVAQLSEINELSLQGELEVGQQLFVPLNPSFIVPELVIKISIVNLRSGPGIEYTTIGFPERGAFATVLGQTIDPTWYLVEMQDGKGTRGWLSAAVVRLLYPTRPETIPLVATVPPTPAP
jgi:LysM repeat protein